VSDCLFCGIAAGEVPSSIIYETKHSFAFRDINPAAPVHLLVVPKEHVASAASLGADHGDLLADLFMAINQVAAQEGIAESGYRIVANVGPDAGMAVHHLHFHLIGGRPMGWPPMRG
jgi:histidine triad (HIT) family protein